MKEPPAPGKRRALIALVWLTATFAGLIGAVWAVGAALTPGPPPGIDTVAQATRLEWPDGARVVDADLAETHTPTPGSRAEVTVAVPAADFGAFIAANDMDAPLLSGTTPAGAATGIIPPGCAIDVCWNGTIVIDDDTVTVSLVTTLL